MLIRVFKPLMDRRTASLKKAAQPQKFMGMPILVLTTVGARTGNERNHILGGHPDGDDAWLIVASNGGAATHPAWFINVARNPDRVWIQIGSRRLKVNVESLQGAERASAYARVVSVAPRYADYMKKTDREIPVLRVTPAS